MDNNKDITTKAILQEVLLNNKDFFLEVVTSFCQDILDKQMAEHIGAAKYQRTDSRKGHRNGYKPRILKTRVGNLYLLVPQDREGNFSTNLFERYQRNEKALVLTMMEAYIEGVSTRRLKDITEKLCGISFSASTVSNLAKSLDSKVLAFRNRRLSSYYPYIIVDATYIKVRQNQTVENMGALIAVGINSQGLREIIAINICNTESYEAYNDLFKDLKSRGLEKVDLVISDDHKGLRQALSKHFQQSSWQRCCFHFIKNLLDSIPKKKRKKIYNDLKTIFLCSSKNEALKRAKEICSKYENEHPLFVSKLDEGVEETLTFMNYPIEHFSKIRTTNMLERLNAELKRRINVIRIFPNMASALRLIGCLCMEYHDEWISLRKYINMEPFHNLKKDRFEKEPSLAIIS